MIRIKKHANQSFLIQAFAYYRRKRKPLKNINYPINVADNASPNTAPSLCIIQHAVIYLQIRVRLYINNRNYYYNNAVGKLFRINLISERSAASVSLPEKKTGASSYNEISVIRLITNIIPNTKRKKIMTLIQVYVYINIIAGTYAYEPLQRCS